MAAVDPGAVGSVTGPVERSWEPADCLLYAVGVGAGVDEAAFTTDNSRGVEQRVLPTFAAVVGRAAPGALAAVGRFEPGTVLHGEQAVAVAGPIAPRGAVRTTTTVTGVYDKGSGAVVVTESESVDAATGEPRFRTRSASFIRGAGGWGGPRGPAAGAPGPDAPDPARPPDRPPDEVVTYETASHQALLYRLSGDRNPLHSDPVLAARAGFDRPILHGLCTYGFTGRALLHALCGSDPARFVSMQGRFSHPVLPGDLLTVQIWVDGDEALFCTETQRGEVVLADGRCRFRAG